MSSLDVAHALEDQETWCLSTAPVSSRDHSWSLMLPPVKPTLSCGSSLATLDATTNATHKDLSHLVADGCH